MMYFQDEYLHLSAEHDALRAEFATVKADNARLQGELDAASQLLRKSETQLMECEAYRIANEKDGREWRSLVSEIRSTMPDWKEREGESFSMSLFRHIGLLRDGNQVR